MENIFIRLANESDLSALHSLYLEFHEFHAKYLPAYLHSLGAPSDQEREISLSKIREVIKGTSSAILVAEISGKPIGMAEIFLKQPDPGSYGAVPVIYAHLQSLAVTEGFRQQGVGSQLLQAAGAWARDRGAVEMRLEVWEFSEGPLIFYENLGYHTIRRTLAKKI